MRKQTGWLFLVLIMSILLCACSAEQSEAAETAAPTAAPAEAPTEPAPTEPQLPEVQLPETDAATGVLMFYFDDHAIHAGAPMADLIDIGIRTEHDLNKIIQPMHMSEVIRVEVDLEDPVVEEVPEETTEATEATEAAEPGATEPAETEPVEETKPVEDPMIFVVAINASGEPQPVSKCRIYSITVNTESGIPFGSGNEEEPFVTGTTTREQLTEAYGEPGYARSGKSQYEEIAYYQYFNSVYFSFKNGVVRQIVASYSANLFGDLAENFTYDLGGAYFGSDCAVAMSQYLDVAPYLDGTAAVDKLEALEESIVMGGQTIVLGTRAAEMPSPFGEPFVNLPMPLNHRYYIRTGRANEEEFYLYNLDGQRNNTADRLVVKGVITENCNYSSWGIDKSKFHPFEYMGLSNDATIGEILEKLGAPMAMQFDSNGRIFYAWMFYEDVKGNELLLRVDPLLNQIIELHVSKYYSGENFFK